MNLTQLWDLLTNPMLLLGAGILAVTLLVSSRSGSGGSAAKGRGPATTWAKVRTRLGYKEAVKAARRRIPEQVCPDEAQLVRKIGKWGNKWLHTQIEDSLVVIGPTRSGKSRNVAIRRVRCAPGSVVATSTKNDLLLACRHTTTARGTVSVYDPTRSMEGHDLDGLNLLRWDPVLGCEDPEVAIRRGSAWASAQPMGNVKNGDWFNKRAADLLTRLLHAAALDGRPITDVARWAQTLTDPVPVDILEAHGRREWADYLRDLAGSRAGETVDAVKMAVGGVLAPLASPKIVATLTPSRAEHFDVEAFIADTNSVFLIAPDRGNSTVAPVFTMLIDEILHAASVRSQRLPGSFLWPPLTAVLDECANIAPLPDLDGYLSDSGGRGIEITPMFQSRDQIKKRWGPDAAGAIWKAATMHLVLPNMKDLDLAKEMEAFAGMRKVTRRSHSTGRGGSSTSTSTEKEPNLPISEIPQIPENTAWLMYRNLPILHIKLPPMPDEEIPEQNHTEAVSVA